MKLFYSPGACSMAAHIVLNELDYAFTLEKTDTSNSVTESGIDYRTINPNGYVPALQTDDGDIVTENMAILQFLADSAPEGGLAPLNGSFAHVRLQEILSFLATELHKAYAPYFAGETMDDQRLEKVETKLARRISALEDRLADGRKYLLGTHYSIADAYAFVLLNWSSVIGLDLSQSPWQKVAAYVARLRKRPAVVKAMAAEGLIDTELAS